MDQSLQGPTGGASVDWRRLLSNLVRSLDERAWGITSPPSWAEVKAARAALAAEAVGDEEGPDVDHILRLAEIIRRVDGSHNLGAAALAEAILSHPGARAVLARYAHQPAPPTAGEVGELVEWLRETGRLLSRRPDIQCRVELRLFDRAADLLERLASPACLALKPSPELTEAFKDLPPGRIELLPEDAQVIEPAEHTILVPARTPAPVAERLPELRGMFERILCVARSSDQKPVGNIELADRLIKAVVSWDALPLPAGEVE